MDISEVKAALGKPVHFLNDRLRCDGTYILTGCIIRRSERGQFFYQAELHDTTQKKAVLIANLNDIERVKL